MSLSNCLLKLNKGKEVFDADETKAIQAIVNKNMGKMSTADAERAAVHKMLDDAIDEQRMVSDLVRKEIGASEKPAETKAPRTEIKQQEIPNGKTTENIELESLLEISTSELTPDQKDRIAELQHKQEVRAENAFEDAADKAEQKAKEQPPEHVQTGVDDRDHFTLERLNQATQKLEPFTFERGEYVRFTLSGHDVFGEIDGISHAKREFSVNGLWYPFGFAYKTERPAEAVKPTVPLSSVIDKMNVKHGGDLNYADRIQTIAVHNDVMERAREGKLSDDEFKASFDALLKNKNGITAELSAMTKPQIFEKFPGLEYRYKNEKKADVIDAVYRYMLSDYVLGESFSHGMGKNAFEDGIKAVVGRTTDATLATYAEKIKKLREERAAQHEAAAAGMENPQTLDDYKRILGAKAHELGEGATFSQARMAMPVEQRAKFDELAAEQSRAARASRKTAQQEQSIRAPGEAVGTTEIIKTKHTKHGHDLWQFNLVQRVSADEFTALARQAKQLGGNYSSYRGNGAIPGWQFRTEEAAKAFRALVAGDATEAKAVAQTRRDAFVDDRSQSAVERLNEMADKLDEQADESLNQERKENTARRARFAASAEAAARSDKAMAATMRNIAQAIESGKAKFLDKIRQKVQVETLRGLVHTAQADMLRKLYPSYSEQEKHNNDPVTKEAADYLMFPTYTAFRSDLAGIGRSLLEVDGTKKLGQQIMKVADDVSDAYLKFAKDNIDKVSSFRTKDGERAAFASKADAEAAIARSGYKGAAIVLPFKRGENLIILSPSEAIKRGVWEGDHDKRITLDPELGAELVEKMGKAARRGAKVSVPWQLENAYDSRKRLAGMGIETPAELRAAVREFIGLREAPKEADKVKQMERAMIGRNNDELDFFPTPGATADEMVQAADIKPGMSVLEPSAGMGHIADRIREAGAEPDVVELSGDRRELLEAKGYNLVGSDFMDIKPREFFTYGDTFKAPDGTVGIMRGHPQGQMGNGRVVLRDENGDSLGYFNRDELVGIKKNGSESGYDRILMNPPFGDRRDAQHVQHAYELLKPGGRLVAIMGEGVFFGKDKKAQEFRDWLESVGGTDEKLDDGTFLDPSLPVNTGTSARMVVIDKPADDENLAFKQDEEQYNGHETSQETTDIYAGRDTRPGTTDEQLRTGRDAFREVLGPYAGRAGISLLGSRIAKDFQQQGASSLIGQVAKTHEDLAVLAQVLRDPRFETFRVFFTKAGRIVGHTGITSRLPGSINIATGDQTLEDVVKDMNRERKALGADGYWMLHNHPNGRSLPSDADMALTAKINGMMPGYHGHVIIDHDEYSNIDRDGVDRTYRMNMPHYFDKDNHEIPHDALNQTMMNAKEVANVGKMIQRRDGFFTLIGRDSSGKVASIAEAPTALLQKGGVQNLRIMATLRRFAAQTGSTNVFAVADSKTLEALKPMVQKGLLMDVVADDAHTARGGPVSARNSVFPSSNTPFNEARPRSVKVEQKNSPYANAADTQEKKIPRLLRIAKKNSMEQDTSVMDHVLGGKFAFQAADKLLTASGAKAIASSAYTRVLDLLGKETIADFVPEKVKAGMVSEYGLDSIYTDRKAEMKAAEAAQNRKSAGLIEMLAALTRAESRVAYQWMQEKPDTEAEQSLTAQLPEQSRATLSMLKKLVSDMGREAVRLGQMSQEAYDRNNMAYLHRTYAKHVLNNEGRLGRFLRTRQLRIKGNQYKGRGIFDEVRMKSVGGDPMFWRKLQEGRADKSLIGERLIRFERRDASTERMDALPGMESKPLGRLREVVYWPTSEPVPAKLGDWVNGGTFEVRDVKGDHLVVWRDFTKEERERMGELDEVRYAVAQTLQMMTHDIEVGRFFDWTAKQYGKVSADGKEVSASESMLHSYGKDEWVQVPSSNVPETKTKKYGALAGMYVPGPVWNDIRQTAGAKIEPFGHTYEVLLQFWKKSKTAWTPGVHMNNVMANFVMADWHDLSSLDLADALKVWANNKKDGYREIYQRFEDSGALGGMFLSNEALRDEIAKRLDDMKDELTGEVEAQQEMTRMGKVLHLFTMAGMTPIKAAQAYASGMETAYQFEDAIFRLAAFTKAIRYGKSDIEAGRIARHAFLNYDINAPWIQELRHTFLPFVSFFYRALPMAINTAKTKPWKVVKLLSFWSIISALGTLGAGGDDDEERKNLPPEKQGRVWGIVPKMVRMPWNHKDGAPVFLDIRRWVPVGDIADMEMGSGMLPPWATPSGVLVLMAEVVLMNKSLFTDKPIVLETDTASEKTEKRLDYVFKAMMPNVPIPDPINMQLPNGEINPLGLSQGSLQTYSYSNIERSLLKREGSIGEVRTTPAAIASAVGIKVSAYPKQNMLAAKLIDKRQRINEVKDAFKKEARNYSNLEHPTPDETRRFEVARDKQVQKLKDIAAEP